MKTYILASLTVLCAIGLAACGSGSSSGSGASSGGSSDGTSNQVLISERPQLSAMESDPAVADPYACGTAGVLICHLPPGNPANRHSLCIGAPAVAHHIAEHHRGDLGDYLGACLADSSGGGGTTGGDTGGTGGTTGGDTTGGTTTGGTTTGSNGDGGQIIDCTDPANHLNSLCG
jgi:hypothetical protein